MKEKINIREWVILVGSMFMIAASTHYIMIPGCFIFGGVSGLVVILTNFIPLSVSTLMLIINTALLVVGMLLLGREFGIKTIVATLINPLFLRLFESISPNPGSVTGDTAINMMILVLVLSFGQAMLFNINASSGGMDIVAKLMNKYFGIKMGTSLAILGYLIVSLSVFVYDTRVLLISFMTTYLNGLVLDHFSDGFMVRKKLCILSDQYEKIQSYIIHDLYRGVTLYETKGGYNGQPRTELVTIVDKHEYRKLLNYISREDPNAFVTVTTIAEVRGYWVQKSAFGG